MRGRGIGFQPVRDATGPTVNADGQDACPSFVCSCIRRKRNPGISVRMAVYDERYRGNDDCTLHLRHIDLWTLIIDRFLMQEWGGDRSPDFDLPQLESDT